MQHDKVLMRSADSMGRAREFDSIAVHNENTISEEGNEKPPHKMHPSRKTRSPASGSAMPKLDYATRLFIMGNEALFLLE